MAVERRRRPHFLAWRPDADERQQPSATWRARTVFQANVSKAQEAVEHAQLSLLVALLLGEEELGSLEALPSDLQVADRTLLLFVRTSPIVAAHVCGGCTHGGRTRGARRPIARSCSGCACEGTRTGTHGDRVHNARSALSVEREC